MSDEKNRFCLLFPNKRIIKNLRYALNSKNVLVTKKLKQFFFELFHYWVGEIVRDLGHVIGYKQRLAFEVGDGIFRICEGSRFVSCSLGARAHSQHAFKNASSPITHPPLPHPYRHHYCGLFHYIGCRDDYPKLGSFVPEHVKFPYKQGCH